MTIKERRKTIYQMCDRHRRAGRKEKGDLLDEMQRVTAMHHKSLLRILNGRLSRKPRIKQRGHTYGVKAADTVRVIARRYDCLRCRRTFRVYPQGVQFSGAHRCPPDCGLW